jgi:hypothetical protein
MTTVRRTGLPLGERADSHRMVLADNSKVSRNLILNVDSWRRERLKICSQFTGIETYVMIWEIGKQENYVSVARFVTGRISVRPGHGVRNGPW